MLKINDSVLVVLRMVSNLQDFYYVAEGTIVKIGSSYHRVRFDTRPSWSGIPVNAALPDTHRARELLQLEANARNLQIQTTAQIQLYRQELEAGEIWNALDVMVTDLRPLINNLHITENEMNHIMNMSLHGTSLDDVFQEAREEHERRVAKLLARLTANVDLEVLKWKDYWGITEVGANWPTSVAQFETGFIYLWRATPDIITYEFRSVKVGEIVESGTMPFVSRGQAKLLVAGEIKERQAKSIHGK